MMYNFSAQHENASEANADTSHLYVQCVPRPTVRCVCPRVLTQLTGPGTLAPAHARDARILLGFGCKQQRPKHLHLAMPDRLVSK